MCELLQPIDLMRINTNSIRLGKTTNAMKQYREKKNMSGVLCSRPYGGGSTKCM